MTLYTHSGALPAHRYIWVEPNAIGQHDWLRGVWFGLTSWPGRAWGCHVLLEGGAVYRNVPLHQLAHRKTDEPWRASDAATWDAYGWQFAALEYPYLSSMNAKVRLQDRREMAGEYWFTVSPVADAFSAVPEQSKEFYFCGLENGRITAQPTNHVLLEDKSFTSTLEWPKFLRRQTDWHSAEDNSNA
jgi:hypothetical protein